jgi:hypothetical protein
VGQRSLDLEGDEAVCAAELVPDRAQDVAGHLNVLDGEVEVDLVRALAFLRQLLDVLVVVVGAEDGLLEDRGVGGHAAEGALLHQPLQLA